MFRLRKGMRYTSVAALFTAISNWVISQPNSTWNDSGTWDDTKTWVD